MGCYPAIQHGQKGLSGDVLIQTCAFVYKLRLNSMASAMVCDIFNAGYRENTGLERMTNVNISNDAGVSTRSSSNESNICDK